ncbi:hypothetical protein WOLCODRAFT_155409 [Wolfiporia cocos MD-104 SS10]|uniref:Uncharacterized protein n=1 Tax=Wolfiporia cocos (strain MD-104) TaxID=742152 RepID=A0A2H3IXP6_WOLCO|nr:hypothetical protein WOLCODRAFT_155409 [Wolfiporia cocos MD-104 SS10]
MEAWKAGYVGYGALRLIKTVKDIASNINGPYSNTMPIIQSSGTGKSRMVDEMAKSIFTLPFKLAPTGVDGATYPASDAAIREYLCHANKYTERDFVIARYLVFFASLLSVVAEEVNHIWGDSPRVLPSEWRAHLETDDKRASLYRRAVEGVPAIWQEVDERAPAKITGLFLSTTSFVAKYAPTYENMPSDRAQAEALQPPYTELPFDCHPNFFPVRGNQYTVDALSTPKFQANFGRPLFWTRYRYGNRTIKEGIVHFARESCFATELAVLDMRIMLDFGPHRDANTVQQCLIESHMRIAVSVPAHREYSYSAYPSEPLLAEAAARIMATIREEQNDDDDNIARTLQNTRRVV